MSQEPKKRHSRARQGKRRASISLRPDAKTVCPNCQAVIVPHVVCRNCGFYRGREVVRRNATPAEITPAK